MISKDVIDELNSIKNSIEKQNVSWGELIYLDAHKEEILELDDIVLAQWAGISEEEYQRR